MNIKSNLILTGIVGSTAQGLAREGSDVDRLGVFIAPTIQISGLYWGPSKESIVTNNPDATYHEVGKYLRLALKCNPTVLELLWLPNDLIEQANTFGRWLRTIRSSFLSEHAVKTAYGGYARQQARKLEERGDGTFGSDLRKRTAKHGRHLLRLLRQGRELLETGDLTVKVDNPEEYFAFDNMDVSEMLNIYSTEDQAFMNTKSVLPKDPDIKGIEYYLNTTRLTFLREYDS